MSCDRFDQTVLFNDPERNADLQDHVQSCNACRRQMDDWISLSSLAAGLQEEWESADLLMRIEEGIRASQQETLARDRRSAWVIASQWAAVLVVAISLGAALFRTLSPSPERPTSAASFEEWLLRESAIADVERAEEAHLESIERLSQLVEQQDVPESPLQVSYREKLLLLDDAIAECEKEIERNRYNAHLRRQLLAIYDTKDETLRQMLEAHQ